MGKIYRARATDLKNNTKITIYNKTLGECLKFLSARYPLPETEGNCWQWTWAVGRAARLSSIVHQLLAGLFGTALNSRLRAFAVEETAPKYDQMAVYLERIGGLVSFFRLCEVFLWGGFHGSVTDREFRGVVVVVLLQLGEVLNSVVMFVVCDSLLMKEVWWVRNSEAHRCVGECCCYGVFLFSFFLLLFLLRRDDRESIDYGSVAIFGVVRGCVRNWRWTVSVIDFAAHCGRWVGYRFMSSWCTWTVEIGLRHLSV